MQQDESPAARIYDSLKARCSHPRLLARRRTPRQPAGRGLRLGFSQGNLKKINFNPPRMIHCP